MKLKPYTQISERWRKVCKHVFNSAERWWDIFGDFQIWHADWTALRVAGCLHQEDGHLQIANRADAREVADRNHDLWLAAAERAVDQAKQARHVYPTKRPDRACYIGDKGVTVYVSQDGSLVTCFRPWVGGSRGTASQQTERAVERAAVRRSHRRASLETTRASGPGKERSHAS